MAHSENLHAESCSFDYLLQTRVNINCAIYPEQKKKKKKFSKIHIVRCVLRIVE